MLQLLFDACLNEWFGLSSCAAAFLVGWLVLVIPVMKDTRNFILG